MSTHFKTALIMGVLLPMIIFGFLGRFAEFVSYHQISYHGWMGSLKSFVPAALFVSVALGVMTALTKSKAWYALLVAVTLASALCFGITDTATNLKGVGSLVLNYKAFIAFIAGYFVAMAVVWPAGHGANEDKEATTGETND